MEMETVKAWADMATDVLIALPHEKGCRFEERKVCLCGKEEAIIQFRLGLVRAEGRRMKGVLIPEGAKHA